MNALVLLAAALSLSSGAAPAQTKAPVASFSKEEADLLGFLDALSMSVEESRERERALLRRMAQLETWQNGLVRLGYLSEARRAALEDVLKPGLVAFDRLTRNKTWVVGVTAKSFSEFWNATRASRKFMAAQISAIERWGHAAMLSRQCAEELNWLKTRWALENEALGRARREAIMRQLEFEEGLVWALSEKSRAQKLLKQWEEARSQVNRLTSFEKSMSSAVFFARKGQLAAPTRGSIEVGFGKVVNPRFNTTVWQRGVDLRAPEGTTVSAVAPGKVVYADWLKGYGYLVIVDHGEGFHSLYAHLREMSARVGGAVLEGDGLGQVGDTGSLKGPFLYFELRYRGTPLDPAPWLRLPSKT